MKTKLLVLFLLTAMLSMAQTNVLRLNLNSHNEATDPTTYTNTLQYNNFKPYVQKFADSVVIKQVKWNMQVETNFIQGVLLNEAASTSTVDFLQASDASPYIEVDVHHHSASFFSHADVAKLLDSCGVAAPHNNVGGFLWQSSYWSTADENWQNFGSGVTGISFPTYTWTPKVIWGAGSKPAHSNDFNAFGIWRPSGATASTFSVHSASANITYIGNGCDWHVFDSTNVQWIKNDFNKTMLYITSLPPSANMFFTASIQTDFREYTGASMINKVFQIVNYIKASPYASSVVWQTLTEKYNSWYGSHTNSVFFEDGCTAYKTAGIFDISNDYLYSLYPNPASDRLTLEIGQFNFESYTVSIFNAVGTLAAKTEITEAKTEIDLSNLSNGIYFVALGSKNGVSKLQKVVIAK